MIFVDDGHSPERVCAITGSPDKVQIAAQMIQHLLIEYNASDIYMFTRLNVLRILIIHVSLLSSYNDHYKLEIL